jgi:hypothetical protein
MVRNILQEIAKAGSLAAFDNVDAFDHTSMAR